jgi:hypothetical protein
MKLVKGYLSYIRKNLKKCLDMPQKLVMFVQTIENWWKTTPRLKTMSQYCKKTHKHHSFDDFLMILKKKSTKCKQSSQ